RVHKNIVGVDSLLVSNAKKRLEVFPVNSPQPVRDLRQVLVLLGPMWAGPWDCEPSFHQTILERFPMLIVKGRNLDIAYSLILIVGNAVEQRRTLTEETRVHREIDGVLTFTGARVDKIHCGLPRFPHPLAFWTGWEAD